MSDAFQRDDEVPFQILSTISATNTAGATSGSGNWMDTAAYTGDILVTLSTGAVTGSVTGKLQAADDANGTNAADITGATFTAISAANKVQSLSVNSDSTAKRYIGFVGTVVTGPVLISVTGHGVKKYN